MGKEARISAEATLTTKGQLTVPAPVREAMGVKTGDRLHFESVRGKFVVTPVRRADLLSLAGVFAGAGKRVGDMGIKELRRRAWSRRGQQLKEHR